MIDFKMTDLNGRWRHITIPVERFNEDIFTQGIGFDGPTTGTPRWRRAIWSLSRIRRPRW